MTFPRLPRPLAAALAVLGLAALYRGALGSGLLNDDYLFLEDARTRPLFESLSDPRGLSNYFRPVSRQIWFEVLSRIGDGAPIVFHLAQFAVWIAALALLLDLLLALVAWPGALAGTLAFALMPFQRVNLLWISCSQDLLALVGVLGALALHRRGRTALALFPATLAMLSKESALALPVAVAAWGLVVRREPRARVLPGAALLALPALAWAAGTFALRRHAPAPPDPLVFDGSHFAAGVVHVVQSMLGLEHPPGFLPALATALPSLPAFALLAAAALAWPGTARPERPAAVAPQRAARFAAVWIVAFGLLTGPAASIWSGYHATLAAVGGAIFVALAARRIGRGGGVVLVAALLVWHSAGASTRAFAVARDPWAWTAHFPAWYFERGASLGARLRADLAAAVPAPERGARFFFAALPPWSGFQMGNGPAIRDLYRDPSLESWYFSQFAESTAADHPCVFLFWNGERFERLYATADDPFFQVACDLLLLDRPEGAMHAIRRAAQTRVTSDQLYWYGWAALWTGDRRTAEASWARLGARDDSLAWANRLRAAKAAFDAGDSLAARRALAEANLAGIGRPQGHAVLGELLRGRSPKYALLETKVAAILAPGDWLARRDLAVGLAAARLDEPAARELDALKQLLPAWREDSVIAGLNATLARRAGPGGPVTEFRTDTRRNAP